MRNVYLDNAATTQIRQSVVEKMNEALCTHYGNPSSSHNMGRLANNGIQSTRKTIAQYLNAKPSEIIFTSGGTEGDNMVLRCAIRDLGVATLITSKIEHHAVLHTAQELEKELGVRVQYVNLNAYGEPDLEHLEELLSSGEEKKLVSLMHVNNEIGNITDVNTIAKCCDVHNALFHSDAVQSVGHFPWDVQQTKVTYLTAAAHKFHGPKGIGFIYVRKGYELKPLIIGGAQENGQRGGTEAHHNIIGLENAMIGAYENLEEERAHITGLKQYFINALRQAIPNVEFNGRSGDFEKSTYTLVNVRFPFNAQKGLMLLFHLNLKGIACSKGSACQSGNTMGSHVLNEILDETERHKPSLRFSFSKYNTPADIDYTVQILAEFANS